MANKNTNLTNDMQGDCESMIYRCYTESDWSQ